jgi:hypothetical protein
MQTDVGSNVGFDLNDPTINTKGPIACLLAISEEIDIVEIANFSKKGGLREKFPPNNGFLQHY